jgi:hypothetical protein
LSAISDEWRTDTARGQHFRAHLVRIQLGRPDAEPVERSLQHLLPAPSNWRALFCALVAADWRTPRERVR